METLTDVALNPDPYLQKGDLVAAALFFESIAMTVIAVFLFFQVNYVPRRWRNHILLGGLIALAAAIAAFYRRDFWVATLTNPVEFKFFDWFVTVPLMGALFFLMARPHGAKIGMLIRIQIAILFMLLCGYLGEAVYPEQAILNGSLATVGLVGIILIIMLEGFNKIQRNAKDPIVRKGYAFLGLSLPITWIAYPIGYLSVPGNLLEGFMSPESVLILYSLANLISKGGLVMGVYAISVMSSEAKGEVKDGPMRDLYNQPSNVQKLANASVLKPASPSSQPASMLKTEGLSQSPWE